MTHSDSIKKHSMTLAWIICGLGAIFYSYEFLLRIAPSVMVTELRNYFHISAEGFGALVGLYYTAYTPMQLIVGGVMDLYGPRRILTFAAALCAIGSFIFGTTHLVWFAGVGRFLIGFGSAFAFVGALKLATVWLPINRFATFTGLVTALGVGGGMVGDLTLTSLVQHYGWQQTIMFGTIFGGILTPVLALVIRDTPNHKSAAKHNIPYREFFRELLLIIKNPQMWISGLIACMLYLALSAFAEIWGINFLQSVYGFSAHEAAFANSLIFFGWLIGGPLTGWLSDKMGNRRLFLSIGSLLSAISIAVLLWLHFSIVFSAILLFLFGLFTSVEVLCFAVGYENASHSVAATAVAFINTLTMASGFIFQPFIGRLLDMMWSGQMVNGLRVYSPQDYRDAMIVLPLAMLVSFFLTLFLRESYKTHPSI